MHCAPHLRCPAIFSTAPAAFTEGDRVTVENEGREQEAVAVAGVTVGCGHLRELLSPFFPALTGDCPPIRCWEFGLPERPAGNAWAAMDAKNRTYVVRGWQDE